MTPPSFSWFQFAAALIVAMVGSSIILGGTMWSARRTLERSRERELRVWLLAVLAELNLDRHEVAQMRAAPNPLFPLERGTLDQSVSHLTDVPPQISVSIQRAALFIGRYNATQPRDPKLLDDVVAPLDAAAATIASYLQGAQFASFESLSDEEIRNWGLRERYDRGAKSRTSSH